MHQIVTAQLAAARSGTHSTKTRGEVRGGGAKPWRQKGTGRARHGSIARAAVEGRRCRVGSAAARSLAERPEEDEGRCAALGAVRAREGRRDRRRRRLVVRQAQDEGSGRRAQELERRGQGAPRPRRSTTATSRTRSATCRRCTCIAEHQLNVYDILNADTIDLHPQRVDASQADCRARTSKQRRRRTVTTASDADGRARHHRGSRRSSEKTYAEAEKGKYTFVVAPRATKPDIRRAVEQIWGVRVRSVNTMRSSRQAGAPPARARARRPDARRAVVTLAAGEKIAIFEA